MKPLGLGLSACIAATAALVGPCLAAEPSGDVIWYSIVTESGTSIGHASEEIVQNADGREIIESQEVDVGEQVGNWTLMLDRFSHSTHISSRTARKEDKTGRTISIETYSQIGRNWSRVDARIDAGKAEVTRETPAKKHNVSVSLPPGVRFDNGDELLRTWKPVTTPRLEFQNFNIDAMAVERVTMEAVAGRPADPLGRIAVLRKRYEGSELRAVSRLLLDGEGRIVEAAQPIFGATLIVKLTDRDTALQTHQAYRVLANVMTKSPYLISQSAIKGHIRYRFSFRDGIEFELPQTGEQRVRAEPGFATVDICDDCGPGLPTDAATLADALKPTAWLQSDHPRLKAIADPIAKLAVSDTRKMEMLLKKARPYLGTLDFTGHYSALETLSRRSGDCTEASVLLAALGRAAGIPTRVVNGLVYSRESYHGVANAFMPHSWTLAFVDGKWRSFDLALDNFDATHIALTVGDGDERSLLASGQLAGLLKWESMVEVRNQPQN